ncbi:MAG: TusE/DsrC/DsvC family sulfur relay protein [Bacteroidetes bacterium]|nr:TusE/DsrC/DsvC family sulfur relay protein [Bacteroidota bacterium]MBU1718680.1 TusE/DsrC/DsvC family sulfur relay protein [Bacteroidota bacterium]
MSQKEYAGVSIAVNDEGYMTESSQWTEDVAKAIAAEEKLELTEKHFAMLKYIRDRVAKGESLTIRGIGKSGIVDIKEFYQLFPGAPLKKATKIAGVPKPSSCI